MGFEGEVLVRRGITVYGVDVDWKVGTDHKINRESHD